MSARSPKSSASLAAVFDAETLRAVLDSASTPTFALDTEGRLFFANQALVTLLGAAPELLAGKTVAELAELTAGVLENPAAYGERVMALAGDCERVTAELVEYHADKRLFFKEISQPIRRPDGSFLGRLFTYYDITREKELDQTKTEFISIASHELRTPMTSIKGSLDLLLGGFAGHLGEEMRELLLIAHSGCERLIRLINDILDLSKIEAGRMQLRLQPMSLLDSVQRSVRTIKSYSDSLQVKLAVDYPRPPPEILGDRDRMDQVITNLLGNAVKFSPAGGTVTVALRALDDAVECRVIDSGPGIPPEQLERVFDRFHQLEVHSRKKGGTGLGLAIARALVEEQGGKIGAESEVGRGSQFVFRIPVAPSPG
ncbi:MAG: sensor histidine kinase [Terriglobia bacterium]